jgi:hypothetical protein
MSSSDAERPQFYAWKAGAVASERQAEAEVSLRFVFVGEAAGDAELSWPQVGARAEGQGRRELQTALDKDATAILSTDSELLKYLKDSKGR